MTSQKQITVTTMDRNVLWTSVALHFAATLLASVGVADVALPFLTAFVLTFVMFLQDRTMFFVFPGLILMTLAFLSPLILAGAPIALKIPPNGTEYDRELILSIYWFIGIFAFYVPYANGLEVRRMPDIRIGKSDLIPCLAGLILLVFTGLMLRDGTLLTAGYRDVTAERFGFIETASLFTLMGLCAARSPLARNILIGCVAVYLAATFLVGLRLRFISVSIVLIACTIGIRIHWKWKLAGLGVAVALFVLGAIRNAGFTGANLGQAFSISNMYNRGALVSTSGGGFQTSKFHAFYVEHIASHDGLTGWHFLVGDILSIFLTRGGLPDSLEVKAQTGRFFDIPGGGLLPGYFYAYLGIGGVIVLSALFTWVFIYILRRTGPQAFPYHVILAAYAPRMLLYDWTVAFKMMVYFFIVQSILSILVSVSQRAPGHGVRKALR